MTWHPSTPLEQRAVDALKARRPLEVTRAEWEELLAALAATTPTLAADLDPIALALTGIPVHITDDPDGGDR